MKSIGNEEFSNTNSSEELRLSFVDNTDEIGGLFSEHFQNDMQSAQLSATFRRYYQLRKFIPIAVRQFLQRRRNGNIEVRPDWYIPDQFIEALECKLRDCGPLTTIHPWPDQSEYGFVLTHDVETAEGLRNVPKIAAIEEELGFRSSWALVPRAYDIDLELIEDLVNRDFEVAVHGYNHDGRLFLSKDIFDSRTIAINDAVKRFGASGFRAPMVHRNLEWLQMLDVEYDASCFDVDPYQAMPGGVGSIWPFIAGKLVELPYTMPQDHTLLITLGETDDTTWRTKFQYLAKRAGLVLMLTHPDYLNSPDRMDLYRSFLSHVRDRDDYWHALPKDTARWWRDRDASQIVDGRIAGPAAARGSICTFETGDDGLAFNRSA